jgi:hypothetical protein
MISPDSPRIKIQKLCEMIIDGLVNGEIVNLEIPKFAINRSTDLLEEIVSERKAEGSVVRSLTKFESQKSYAQILAIAGMAAELMSSEYNLHHSVVNS